MKRFLYFIVVSFCLYSCSDDLLYDIPNFVPELVVDGYIEKDQLAKVELTLSSPYLGSVDSIDLFKLVVRGAKVTLYGNGESEILMLVKNPDAYPNNIYRSNSIRGIEGNRYDLKVEYEGRLITATTVIPKGADFSNVWYTFKNDTLAQVMATLSDNINNKDYYYIQTRRFNNDTRFHPIQLPLFDDQYFNGQSADFSINRGNKNFDLKIDNIFFELGDTIDIKLNTCDQFVFSFLKSFFKDIVNTGNPFAASNNPVYYNVQGDGIGVWAGYSSSYYRIVIQ